MKIMNRIKNYVLSGRVPVWGILKSVNMLDANLISGTIENGCSYKKYELYLKHNNKKYKLTTYEDEFKELKVSVDEC